MLKDNEYCISIPKQDWELFKEMQSEGRTREFTFSTFQNLESDITLIIREVEE